jgi:hypothetical protein
MVVVRRRIGDDAVGWREQFEISHAGIVRREEDADIAGDTGDDEAMVRTECLRTTAQRPSSGKAFCVPPKC